MEKISKISRFWLKFREYFLKHRKPILIITGIFVICAVGLAIFIATSSSKVPAKKATTNKTSSAIKQPEPVKYYSKLTGNLVADKSEIDKPVTGIMIENSPESRPQSGLKDSGIVFEAIAEGGITRFLVLYQQEKPQMVGPVRSIRLYDIDWLAPFNASIAHVGGSAAALVEVRNGSYRDIDQFFNSSSYWRASDRYAPHNVYTSFARLDALNLEKGYTSSNFTGFSRIDGKPVDKPDASNIDVTISSDLYNSSYVYNKTTNTYARSQAGEPHLDRESGQISPSVVIAMRVNETTILEDGYRQSITTTGSGDATIFQNGTAINATWNKLSKTDQITFKDINGKDIPLVRGQTWITAIPYDNGGIAWK